MHKFIAVDNRTSKILEGVDPDVEDPDAAGAIGKGSDANKTVHFVGRWQNNRGEKGPLSETVSATVTG